MKKVIRFAAALFAVCMLLGTLPLVAHAEDSSISNFNQSGYIVSWDYEDKSSMSPEFEFTGLWQNSIPYVKYEYRSQYKEYVDMTWTESWDMYKGKTVGSVSVDFEQLLEYFSARSSTPLETGTYAITINMKRSATTVASKSFAFKYAARPEGVHGVRVDGGSATPFIGKPGALVALKASNKAGYTFDHWQIDEGVAIIDEPDKSTAGLTIGMTDVKVTAVYKMTGTQYNVTVLGDGAYGSGKAFEGENVAIGVVEQRWDDFLGWEVVSGGVSLAWPNDSITSFKMPGNDVVIRANFSGDASGNPFVDVKSDDYFYDPVMWAVENGITLGTDETHFSPNATCTRAQVVTFLWRAKGSPEPVGANNPFKDVKSDDYYYKAVLWAVENGITAGTDPDRFSPNAGCTRAQVVTFLWRTEGEPGNTLASNPFNDVKDGEYYYPAVMWAVENDITKGTTDVTFGPDETCTRAQIVTFLYRDLA